MTSRTSPARTGCRPRALAAAAAGAAFLVVSAGCTTEPQPIPGEPSASASAPAPPPTPGPHELSMVPIADGRIADALDRLDGVVADARGPAGVPAMAVAVVHDGETVFARGYGHLGGPGTSGGPGADASTPPTAASHDAGGDGGAGPVDADTLFDLGGLSAPVSATVAATQLTGGLSWSTPIRQLLPGFAVSGDYVSSHATVGDAFAGTIPFPDGAGTIAAQLGLDRHDLIDRVRALTDEPFRRRGRAGDLGPTIGAAALAESAGSDWAGLASRSIFAPLGMTSTTMRAGDAQPGIRAAAPQVRIDGRYTEADRGWTDAISPAAGIRSTAADMGRWMATVLDGGRRGGDQVIPAAPLAQALSAQVVDADPSAPADPRVRSAARGYGFSVTVSPAGRVVVGARGALPATGGAAGPDAALTLIPSARIGIVTLTNAVRTPGNSVHAAEQVNAEFADLVQFGDTTRDWGAWLREQAAGGPVPARAPAPKSPRPAADRPPASYDGVYRNAFFGEAQVRTVNDTTRLTVGPGRVRFRLARIDGDVFAVTPDGMGGQAPAESPAYGTDAAARGVGAGRSAPDRSAPDRSVPGRSASFRAAYPTAHVVFDGDELTIDFADQAGVFRR